MKAGLSSAGKVVVITNHSDLKVTSGGELKPLAVIFSLSLLLGYLKNPESMQKPKYIVLLRRPDLFVSAVSQDDIAHRGATQGVLLLHRRNIKAYFREGLSDVPVS